MKPIFALDSSGKTAGVCVLHKGQVLYEELLDAGLTHSETLLSLAMRAFAATGLAPQHVGLYAVSAGPGSFTGLRIGMSLVKGLALPHNTPAMGFSTLEALALASGLEGLVVPALDARRGEVYWAAFDGADGCRRLHEDSAGPAEDAAALAGSWQGPAYFVGDGAEICYNIPNCGQAVRRPHTLAKPNIALGVARLAEKHWVPGAENPAAALQPRYLRLSQAERERRVRSTSDGFAKGETS